MGRTLRESTALVYGAGALGGAACLVLASAGLGRLVVVDQGAVEPADLSGQPLFGDADLGRRWVEATADRLGVLFPGLRVEARDERPEAALDPALLAGAGVVADCTGRFSAMFPVNDAAVAAGRPLVHASAVGLTAHLLTVVPGSTGCLRCLFEGPPPPGAVPGPAQAGLFGPLAAFAGALAGREALRLLAGEPPALAGRLLAYEARSARSRSLPVNRRPGCAGCAAAAPPGGSP
ncbi:MAG: ThiF family adenylyltransferase [Deltaproteobacteria bacterium]|nr:ThiF family adenylyltransferase [Deltaproteobacteria bacterium]